MVSAIEKPLQKTGQAANVPETSNVRRIVFFGNWKDLSFKPFKFLFPVRIIITEDKKLFVAIESSLSTYQSHITLVRKLYGPLTTEAEIQSLSPFRPLTQTSSEMEKEQKKINSLNKVRDVTVDLGDFKTHFKQAINAIAAGDEETLRKFCPDPMQISENAEPSLEDIF